MSDKTFILSAAGLKNIVSLKKEPEIIRENDFDAKNLAKDDFIFNFGEYKVRMHTFLAEFISSRVSKLHQADPTINILNFFKPSNNENNKTKEIFDLSLINAFINISVGNEITINQTMIEKLLFLSIILDNSNLYDEMNKLYSIFDNNEHDKIDQYLEYLIFYEEQNQQDHYIKKYHDKIIDFISSHFYLIEEKKLLKLRKNVLYLIISNDQLKLNNEDSLFDFIEKLFSKEEYLYENKILFYEQIEMIYLSESKFRMMIENIDYNQISRDLWSKIKECFYCEYQINKSKSNQNRYSNDDYHNKNKKQNEKENQYKTICFDNDSNHRFNGIICNLYKSQNPKYDEKIIKITASSIYSDYQPQNVIEYENNNSVFYSKEEKDSWIKFDFNKFKVNPSAYSLRSNDWGGVGHWHPQNWVIEGSNDDTQWTILDTHTNDHSIDDRSKSNTFIIQNKNNIFYRYLRLRQTGLNTINNNTLIISAIEYFGTIEES